MSDRHSGSDPVEALADEFAERYRRGERPSLTEYVEKYPALAEQIREVFPALVAMEELGSVQCPATGPLAATATNRDPVPQQLGEYRILREVGRGGMGVVYEAVQESLARHVALKVLPMHSLLNRTHLERFRREARAAARLHHTNIVPVFGIGEHAGVHYFAMQFIEGQGLDEVLKEVQRIRRQKDSSSADCGERTADLSRSIARDLLSGRFEVNDPGCAGTHSTPSADAIQPLPPTSDAALLTLDPSRRSHLSAQTDPHYFRSVAHMGLQVAEALDYAHKQGILHRDVKPSNLLLDTRGTVWVSDFGLAKHAADLQDGARPEGQRDEVDLTRTGDIVGTLRYMAPERFNGGSEPRSDVYGLGITLYEMLTMHPAFHDSNRARLIERVMHDDPPRPRKLDPHIPRDLETIVLKTIAKEPDDRYTTAADLAEDLRRFLADQPIRARRTSLAERALKWARRRPATAALLTVTALAMLGLTALAGGLWYNAEKRAAAVQDLAAARSDLGAARQELAAVEERIPSIQRAADEAEQDLLLTRYLNDVARGQREWLANNVLGAEHVLENCPPALRRWEWHYVKRLCHADLLTLREEGGPVAFSPDGKHLASAGFGDMVRIQSAGFGDVIRIRDADTGREVQTLQGQPGWVTALAYSPDGERIVAGLSRINVNDFAGIKVWNAATGRELLSLRGPNDSALAVAFSSDGKRLAAAGYGRSEQSVKVWDAATGQQLLTLGGHRCVAFSPDGDRLASAGTEKTAKVWDLTTGQVVLTLDTHMGDVEDVAYSRCRQWLASASEDGTVRIWEALTGRLALTLRGHTGSVNGVAFSSDGKRLASASEDRTIKVWDVATGQELFTFRGHKEAPTCVAFSPDGKRLASARRAPGLCDLKVWDATRGQEALIVRGHARPVTCVAFSPDGRRLASAGFGDSVKVHDSATGQELLAFRSHTGQVHSLAISPDGRRVVSAADQVQVWDAETGEVIFTLAKAESAAYSPDGVRIATAGYDRATVWDAATGQEVLTLSGAGNWVVFSPDGKQLATAGAPRGEVKVWDAATGRDIRSLPGSIFGGGRVVFSPDGKWLVYFNAGGVFKVWNVATGEKALDLRGPTEGILGVAFSPGGERIATVGRGVRIWDARTGREALTLHVPGYAVAFSPDGWRLASSDLAGTVRVWDAIPWTGKFLAEK